MLHLFSLAGTATHLDVYPLLAEDDDPQGHTYPR